MSEVHQAWAEQTDDGPRVVVRIPGSDVEWAMEPGAARRFGHALISAARAGEAGQGKDLRTKVEP